MVAAVAPAIATNAQHVRAWTAPGRDGRSRFRKIEKGWSVHQLVAIGTVASISNACGCVCPKRVE